MVFEQKHGGLCGHSVWVSKRQIHAECFRSLNYLNIKKEKAASVKLAAFSFLFSFDGHSFLVCSDLAVVRIYRAVKFISKSSVTVTTCGLN